MKNMKKRLFGLVMAGVMMMSLAVSVSAANTSAANPFDYYTDFTIEKNGCVVKEDGVYDRDGKRLFPMKDGYTVEGQYLDRDFKVVYPEEVQEMEKDDSPLTRSDRVINSSAFMPYNSDGTQGNYIGYREALGNSAQFVVTTANNTSTYNAVWMREGGYAISSYYPNLAIGSEISISTLTPGEDFSVKISSNDCPRNGVTAFFTLTIRE